MKTFRSILYIIFVSLLGGYTATVSAFFVSDLSSSKIDIYHLRSLMSLSIFYNDSSILRFVSRDTPLNVRGYTPRDLVSLSGAHIDEAGRRSQLRSEARDRLSEMATDFEKEFGVPLMVVSGYRSKDYQQRMWDLGRCTDSLCAPPGQSEHQLGLAVDIFDASTETEFMANPRYRLYYAWLREHAAQYGWTQSYQKGIQIDAYEVEPWHWRYVGRDMAERLARLGWTFTEFVRFQESLQRHQGF